MNTTEQRLKRLEGIMTEREDDTVGLKTLIIELDRKLDRWIEAIDRRFEAIERRFEALDLRFEALDRRFEALDRRFEVIDRRFEAVDRRFEASDRRFEAIERRLFWIVGMQFATLLTVVTGLLGVMAKLP